MGVVFQCTDPGNLNRVNTDIGHLIPFCRWYFNIVLPNIKYTCIAYPGYYNSWPNLGPIRTMLQIPIVLLGQLSIDSNIHKYNRVDLSQSKLSVMNLML